MWHGLLVVRACASHRPAVSAEGCAGWFWAAAGGVGSVCRASDRRAESIAWTSSASSTPGAAGWGLSVAGGRALLLPVAILGVLAALYALAWGISRIGGSVRRSAPAWLCGYARESDAHRYGAHNLYGEVKRYLHWAGGVKKPH